MINKINQGETPIFRGVFWDNVGEEKVVVNLEDKVVIARVYNPYYKKELLYSSASPTPSGYYPIIISKYEESEYTKSMYSFTISKQDTATMLGECTCSLALQDVAGNSIIGDEDLKFTVVNSPLGRELA